MCWPSSGHGRHGHPHGPVLRRGAHTGRGGGAQQGRRSAAVRAAASSGPSGRMSPLVVALCVTLPVRITRAIRRTPVIFALLRCRVGAQDTV